MSDEDPQSITDLAHERGPDGEPLPVERIAKVRRTEEHLGEDESEDREVIEVPVDVYPAGDGQRNLWKRRLEDEGVELSEETQEELFEKFAAVEPEDFNGAKTWADVRPKITDALGEVILAEIFDVPQDQFFKALDEWSGEAAREGN